MRPTTTDPTEVPASLRDLVRRVADDLTTRLGLRSCWFEPFPFDALLPRIEPGRIVLPAAEPAARSYAEWQSGDGVELPVRFGDLTLGRFVLVPQESTCGIAIPPESRAEAIAIASAGGDELGRHWIATKPRVSA